MAGANALPPTAVPSSQLYMLLLTMKIIINLTDGPGILILTMKNIVKWSSGGRAATKMLLTLILPMSLPSQLQGIEPATPQTN
ncbi:hypothetical protein J2Z66_004204 [Paenibacillus eucommiae]|uniref:Uncharacterized protein n=1 Tax=Paenibacillus eucommiae TaxID=1355755 RepID=A0ABS4IYG2_9BACL|nr:hypothetical protein [Paenibacillus eucommiae]